MVVSKPGLPADPSTRPESSPAVLFLLLATGVALVAGLWWWGSSSSRVASTRSLVKNLRIAETPGGLLMAPFVGDRACAECHPGQDAMHARSGHSRTFRPAVDRVLARDLDGTRIVDPELPDVTWNYAVRDDLFEVNRVDGDGAVRLLIDYAFGSGHHATTFVSLDVAEPDRPACLEHRLTYFAADNKLGITPGQSADAFHLHKTLLGAILPPEATLKCFRCHTSATSAEGPMRLDPETMIPNVTCERCHGSGARHIELVRRGEELDLAIAFAPGRWTADQQMRMCGSCHRHPDRFEPGAIRVDNPEMVRHQPVGLMQSACYQRSDGALSCITCHDPHARTSTDESAYVATCLDCHRPEAPEVACPISPRKGCLECHMPRRDAGQGFPLTDHWIRVVGPEESLGPHPPASPTSPSGAGHGDVN